MEADSYPLASFPDIPFEYTAILKSRGIRSCGDLLAWVKDSPDMEALSTDTGIPDYRIGEILELCRLSVDHGLEPHEARKLYDQKQ